MLNKMIFHQRLERVQPDILRSGDVGIQVDIVGVDVVLDHMLVDPGDSRATDPVLGRTEHPVDRWVARN